MVWEVRQKLQKLPNVEEHKIKLHEIVSTIATILKDDHVNPATKQALRTAASVARSALRRWDRWPTRNVDKSWEDIIYEVSHEPSILWHYITTLRGPDKDDSWHSAKVLFTCPLRGKTVMALDVDDFLALSRDDVVHGFIDINTRKEELRHYLHHIVSVWECFYPSIAELLRGVFFVGNIKVDIGAIRYIELMRKWLQNSEVIITEKEGKDE